MRTLQPAFPHGSTHWALLGVAWLMATSTSALAQSGEQALYLKLTTILQRAQSGDPATLPTPGNPPKPTPAYPDQALSSNARVETLLLDVRINNQAISGVVQAEQALGGPLLLPAEAWQEARLTPAGGVRTLTDGSPAYSLDAVPGVSYRINRQSQSIEITAPAAAFMGSTLKLQDEMPAAPPRPPPGLLLNYDVSVRSNAAGGTVSSGAVLEAIAFSRLGNFVSSTLIRNEGGQRAVERLDTFWRYDSPERLETLVVGDTVGVGGGWSRPARYGGVRWGRDFRQRPGFVTFPQLSLSGEAALPSTVDVLVNNARRSSQQVPPGPFDLTNVPVVAGAGEINLVVRDLLGRETVLRQSYYLAPQLLAVGLTDYSFEAGRLRSGYGQSSHYGAVFGAATWRQGLTSRLTGEVRIEVQAERRAAGVELAGLVESWGLGRIALASSSDSTQGVAERGNLLRLSMERSTPSGGGALQYQRTSRGFAPFGEATGPLVVAQRARESWLASFGGTLWGQVTSGVNYVSQSRWDGDSIKTAGLSLNAPLWRRVGLGVSLNKRLDGDRAWQAGISVNMTLDNGIQTAARTDVAGGVKARASVSAASNPPAGPGLGWRTEVSTIDSQRARAGLQVNTSQTELALEGASDASGHVATRAGARGSMGWLAGMPFASRSIGQGSFAVVEVENIAGVPIRRSNQVVAETDQRGLAFVPGLLPWQKNEIAIDPVDLPLDAEIDETVKYVTPFSGSGSVIKFAVQRQRRAAVVLLQADGQPVPVGTKVKLLPAGAEFVAGRRGEVWLSGLAAVRQPVQVTWPAGGCRLDLTVPATDGDAPLKIGPIACEKN